MAETKNFFSALNGDSDDEGSSNNRDVVKKQNNADRQKTLKSKGNTRKEKEISRTTTNNKAGNKNRNGERRNNNNNGERRNNNGERRSNNNGDGSNNHKRAPRRDFDRRSGTGRGKEGKKEGAGAHNWGKEGATELPPAEDSAAAASTEEAAVAEEAAPVEEEVNQLTLEEYEAEREAKRSGEAFEAVQRRKVAAPSGVGESYRKKSAEDNEDESFLKMGTSKKKRNRARQAAKRVLDTGFSVKADPTANVEEAGGFSSRGGRGGSRQGGDRERRPRREGGDNRRGGPRGGAPRGGARGAATKTTPDAADVNAFPSLK